MGWGDCAYWRLSSAYEAQGGPAAMLRGVGVKYVFLRDVPRSQAAMLRDMTEE